MLDGTENLRVCRVFRSENIPAGVEVARFRGDVRVSVLLGQKISKALELLRRPRFYPGEGESASSSWVSS